MVDESDAVQELSRTMRWWWLILTYLRNVWTCPVHR